MADPATVDNRAVAGGPAIPVVIENLNLPTAGAPSGTPTVVQIADGVITGQKVTVAIFHNADNQVLSGTSYGLLTGGVAQLLNYLGNLDRQRETSVDGIAPVGISTGAAQFAMAFLTTDSTDNFAAGTRTFTPVLMSGTLFGVAWSIQVGSVLTLDIGGNAENVLVTAVTATTFTCVTAKAHNGTVTPFQIAGFVYNQERDAIGEGPLASGGGAAVALEYMYNGGGPGNQNIDATRDLMGKLWSTQTISAGGGAASSSLTLNAGPTGLQPGQWIYLTGGTAEWVQVRKDYVVGSTTVPLASATVNGSHTAIGYDAFGDLTGAGSSIVGEGGEAVWLFDPTATSNPLLLQRPNIAVTLLASASRTTTQTSADQANVNGHYLHVILDVTIIGTGSLTLSILGKDPASGKYYTLLAGAVVNSNSTNVYKVGPALTAAANAAANDFVPRTFQIVVTANNANPVTYTVGYNLNE